MTARILQPRNADGPLDQYPQPWQWWGSPKPVITNGHTQNQPGETIEPVANEDMSWTFTLPANASPDARRRVERLWIVDGRAATYTHGDILVFEGIVSATLGAASATDAHWHLLWQAHGPGGPPTSTWRPPPVSLTVRNGQLRLGGGEGHPSHSWTDSTSYYAWTKPLATWTEGKQYRFRIEMLVGSGTSSWVSAWVDGQQILTRWVPQGIKSGVNTGCYPGTIYSTSATPEGDWLNSRSGLYRGTDAGTTPPTYEQSSRWWPLDASPSHQP